MASKSIKASVLIGGSVSGSLTSALGKTQTGITRIGEAIATVERRQRLMARSIDVFGRAGKNVERLRAQYGELAREADRLRIAQTRLATATARVKANDDRKRELGGVFRERATTLGATVAGAAFSVREAVKFESAMLGVAKQVEGARDAGGKLTPVYDAMRREIQGLGREIPIATNEIAGMVAAGARMGVARKELIGFVRTSAMMADAFELPSDQLADDMGKIAGLFGIPIPRIGELADSINYLDDNAISKGGDIIDVLRRIGGMAQTLRMPAKEAAALGSTFLTLGSSAEVAGTSSNAVMRILGAATAQSKRVRTGLASLGFAPEAVQASMAKDPTGTILRVLDALNKLNAEQRMVAATRIFGAEYGDDVAKLAVGVNEYRRQLSLANSEAAKGSMSREFGSRLQTTGAQWQLAKNRATELAVNLGSALLPAVNDLMKSVAPMVSGFADFARDNPGIVRGVVGLTVGLAALRVATVGARLAWVTAKTPFLQLQQGIAKFRADKAVGQLGRVGTAAVRMGGVVRTALMAIGAVGAGPIAIAVGALTVGALVVRKYWQPIRAFFAGTFAGFGSAARAGMAELSAALAPARPAFDAIGSAIGGVVRWFGALLAPVQATQSQLAGATAAGQSFGATLGRAAMTGVRALAAVVRVAVSVGTVFVNVGSRIIDGWRAAFDIVRNIVGSAADWIAKRIAPVANLVGAVQRGVARAMGSTPADAAPVAAPTPAASKPVAVAAPKPAAPAASKPVAVAAPKPAAPAAPKAVAVAAPKPVASASSGRVVSLADARARRSTAPAVAPKPVAPKPQAATRSAALPAPPKRREPPPLQASARPRATGAAAPAGKTEIHIHQQPGESADALAERVVAKMDARSRAQQRGRLADEAA